VARGTQHRKRRPAADASASPAVAAKRKAKQPSWEDELFFSRLRRHAKWMYVLLILVFAGGFVLFGVGSGSSGIGDFLQNNVNQSSSSGPSTGSLEKKVREHPKDAKAWHDLATKYSADQKIDKAISALTRFTTLRPNNETALQELAGLYARKADAYRTVAAAAQAEAQVVAPGSIFQPAATTALGRAYQDPNALQDQVSNAVSQRASEKAQDAFTKLTTVSQQAISVYKRLIKLDPTDATRQIQLAEAAQNASDSKTAIAAYRRFLKLAPDDPLVPAVKAQLKQLTAPSAVSASTG
jgi:DNA-binding SARP family transcriptional activator